MKTVLPAILLGMAAPALSAPTCYSYVLIVSRATGEWPGASAGFKDMTKAVLNAVPGGTQYNTNYPADLTEQSPKTGGADVIRYINNGLAQCPGQKYVLLGYSQGATVSAYALNNFNDPGSVGYKSIRAAVLEGNPAHESGQSANVDQSGGSSTRNCKGFQYTSRERVSSPWYASNKLLDICYQGDTYCCLPTPPPLINAPLPHLWYGGTKSVQDLGANFIISRLRAN